MAVTDTCLSIVCRIFYLPESEVKVEPDGFCFKLKSICFYDAKRILKV